MKAGEFDIVGMLRNEVDKTSLLSEIMMHARHALWVKM